VAARTVRVRVGELDIDVEVSPVAGTEPTSKASRAADAVLDAFGQAKEAIVEIAASMAEVVEAHRGPRRPHRLEVSFALKVSAQGIVIVAGITRSLLSCRFTPPYMGRRVVH
jgi:hypothetical protein